MPRPWLAAAAFAAALFPAAPAAADEAAQLMAELMSGRPVGGPIALPDTSGRVRTLGDFRGRYVLLYFGYTFCPDVCPTDMARIAGAIRKLGRRGQRVQPLFVTLDPERDTPALLRRYARSFHPRFVALRGTPEQTRRIARSYKVWFGPAAPGASSEPLLNHSAFVFLLDPAGRYLAFFPPGTPSERMAQYVGEQMDGAQAARAQPSPRR